MILVRILLTSLIVYLIIRSFIKHGQENEPDRPLDKSEGKGKPETRKISKNVGEYVDYEELKEDNK
ncbi:MAG: hypothetical protein IPH69_17615 [Bacteroidales bacterium]|nr:hypothetical protein [Bacteroidales bacterium]